MDCNNSNSNQREWLKIELESELSRTQEVRVRQSIEFIFVRRVVLFVVRSVDSKDNIQIALGLFFLVLGCWCDYDHRDVGKDHVSVNFSDFIRE